MFHILSKKDINFLIDKKFIVYTRDNNRFAAITEKGENFLKMNLYPWRDPVSKKVEIFIEPCSEIKKKIIDERESILYSEERFIRGQCNIHFNSNIFIYPDTYEFWKRVLNNSFKEIKL